MFYAHLANARHQIKRLDAELHVIAVVFNPLRFISRYNLFGDFRKHAEDAGARVWVAELALGERKFQMAREDDFQFRTSTELWHKEALINAAVSRLPPDWKYVAWVDADVAFLNPDWVHETMQQLQHYSIVQMFAQAIDLGPHGEPIDQFQSFACSHVSGRMAGPPRIGGVGASYYGAGKFWHPGYGWAYRRSAWDALGGMLDINIVGGGDHQMAYAFLGRVDETIPKNSHKNYIAIIKNWEKRAASLKEDIGFLPSTIVHHWHGRKVSRGYFDRWRILTGNAFDPLYDLTHDWQRLYMLTGNKPKLRDQLRSYFRMRNEDGVEL